MSTGTITYHFGSRRSLLLDAIDYGYWHLPPTLFELPPVDALRWVLHRYELSDDSRRTWWRFWLAITSHSQCDAEIAERLVRQHNSIVDRWRTCLERGVLDGQLRADFDPATEAARLAAYAHGLAITQLVDPSTTGWAAAELSCEVDALRVACQGDGTTCLP
jgi:AcrR family transcriptional regulator